MKKYPGESWLHKGFFVKSGEFREPRKGEYYLSGAIPCAYVAPNDLTMKFHIAKPYTEPPKARIIDGFMYKLEKPS